MIPANNIKLIIFDVDGTLIDTDDLIIKSYEKLFKDFRPNYELTEKEKVSFLGPPLQEMFPKYFKEDFNELLEVYYEYSEVHKKEFAYIYPRAIEALQYLKDKGYYLAVVTSRFRNSADLMLKDFDLTKYFEYVITLNDVQKPKPDPEGINKCIEYFKVTKEETLYIGDNQTDLNAGRNANVFTGLVSWSKGRDNAALKPDLLLDDYKLLKEIF